MTRFSKDIIDTAIALLDVGMAYATVERVLKERFPEDTKALEHATIVKWNKQYRDGKPPMNKKPEIFTMLSLKIKSGCWNNADVKMKRWFA